MALAQARRHRRRVAAIVTCRAFDPGASSNALDYGRRALVTVAISLSPASLVLKRDVDCRNLTIASVAVSEPAITDQLWPLR